ncbi:MAG: hypothetical protein AB7J35_03265 [Dehalococcoidia bacterium]
MATSRKPFTAGAFAAASSAALAANHRLQAEVDAAANCEQQAAAREMISTVIRTLIEEPAPEGMA